MTSPSLSSAPGPSTKQTAAPASGAAVERYYLMHLMGAVFPFTAGAVLYGWRAIGLMALLIVCTLGAVVVWRKIGARGASLHMAHALWLAVLLGLMLSAHLMNNSAPGDIARFTMTWTIIPAAAILLVACLWLFGGIGFSRFHPVLVTYLLLALTFYPLLPQHDILHRHRLLAGDIAKSVSIDDPQVQREEAWIYWDKRRLADAVHFDSTAAESLSLYTRGRGYDRRTWFSINALLHDAMPPMEDLVVGGHPGPIGISSTIAVLIGGLFLIYRGAIRYRVPLIAVLAAYLWLLVLPVPMTIAETGVQWRSVALPGAHLDWATMLTFANYELLASPLIFMSLFLATNPSICPLSRKAQVTWAFILGTLAAACQLYISCLIGPYIALLLAAQLSLFLERRLGPRGRRRKPEAGAIAG